MYLLRRSLILFDIRRGLSTQQLRGDAMALAPHRPNAVNKHKHGRIVFKCKLSATLSYVTTHLFLFLGASTDPGRVPNEWQWNSNNNRLVANFKVSPS